MTTNTQCITDLTTQQYIDGELTETERILVEEHLSACRSCADKIQKRAQWVGLVKCSLEKKNVESTEIPEFKLDANPIDRRIKPKIVRSFLKMAAIVTVILGSTFLLTKNKALVYQPTEDDVELWLEATSGNDANYDWHQRQMSIPPIESIVEPGNRLLN